MRNFSPLNSNIGRVTPGSIIGAALVSLGLWFIQQPKDQRAALACKPLEALEPWVTVKETKNDPFGAGLNEAFRTLTARCPQTVGQHAGDVAAKASAGLAQAVGQVKGIQNRKIEAVIDAEHLRIFGIGDARLLGVTVIPERRLKATEYLRQEVMGKSLAVTIDPQRDAERQPLVTVTLEDGQLLNATMIQQGMARPWTTPGAWRTWADQPALRQSD